MNKIENKIDIKFKEQENNNENKTMQRAQSQKRITIPKPFKLTENKPRILKEPNELKNNFSMKPFPINDYNKTSLSEIEEKRKIIMQKKKKTIKNKKKKKKIFLKMTY